MPRAKEFDETLVLDQALEIFRARGFKHTSFDDLTKQLGVSRQSLYDTYGDKNTLFHATLGRYLDRSLEYMSRALDDPAPIQEVMAKFFEAMVSSNCSKNTGCLMVNSMVELAPHDPEVRVLAQSHARAIEGKFATRLSAAQLKGEISKDKDPLALARFFYNTMLGLGVASRALGDKDAIRSTTTVALSVLN